MFFSQINFFNYFWGKYKSKFFNNNNEKNAFVPYAFDEHLCKGSVFH